MKDRTARSFWVGGWIVAALSMSTPLMASAKDNIASLQSETAIVDTSPATAQSAKTTQTSDTTQSPDTTQTPTQASDTTQTSDTKQTSDATQTASKPLQGGVSKLRQLLDATEKSELYPIAVQKLTSGMKLSAEEYRSLGAGCIGMEYDRPFFQNRAIVSTVYKDSPADRAGLREGDTIIDNNDQDDDDAKEHPEIPQWKVTCGQAGTDVTVTVLRHNKPVNITLTRMNIEDITNETARHEWEKVLSELGHPTEGEYSYTP
jgi:C-terminal processing protease CtpA/Prc